MEQLSFERGAPEGPRDGARASAALGLVVLLVTLVAVSLSGADAAGPDRSGAAGHDLDDLPLGRPGRRF